MVCSVLALPHVRIDLTRRWVEPIDGVAERLTTVESRLLAYLAEHSDRVVGREELLAEVWNYSSSTMSRAVDTTVRRVRTKIEVDPARPQWLLTVHGAGYRLVLDQEQAPPPVEPPPAPRQVVVIGDRTIDLDRAKIDGPDGSAPLTANEVALLAVLIARGGRSFERDALQRTVWGSSAGRPLDHAISRLRRKLEVDAARPSILVTTMDGYRLELGATPVAPERAGNLPSDTDRWIGRERELEAIVDRVDAGDRLVVLVGPGGIGKTRLAATAARRLAEARGVAGWWVELAGVDTVDDLHAAVARTLQVPLAEGDPADRVVRAVAALGPSVVVLDNLEELAGTGSAAIHRLVEAAPDTLFLATTRILLRVQGERRIEVGPMTPADAAALFTERAIRPPSDGEGSAVEALVAELDGVPLAVELAAAATRVLSVGELRVRSRDRLLGSGDRSRPERQRSLAASLDGSWELASPWARAALAQLSVFRGGFTVDQAEQVLDLAAWPEAEWTVDVLEELSDASLLRLAPDGSRFTMLAMVSRYAADHLPDGERAAAEVRHGRALAGLGAPEVLLGVDGPREVEVQRMLAAERANLIVATERAIARGDAAIASAAGCAAAQALTLDGPVRLSAELLERVAAIPGSEPRVATAAGRAWLRLGDVDRADVRFQGAAAADPWAILGLIDVGRRRHLVDPEDVAEEVLATAVATGDKVLACAARVEIGARLRSRMDNDRAREELEAALHLAIGLGARSRRARIEARLGRLDRALGRYVDARARFRSALAIATDVGDRALQGLVLVDQSALANRMGEAAEVSAILREAVRVMREIGDRHGEGLALQQLGRSLSLSGDYEEAERTLAEAMAIAREGGASELLFVAEFHHAQSDMDHGRYADAERRLLAMRDQCRQTGFVRGEAGVLASLGNAVRHLGRAQEARELYTEAMALFRSFGDDVSAGVMIGNLALVAETDGDVARARELTLEALEIHRRTGDVAYTAGWYQTLARLALRDGDPVAAERHVLESIDRYRKVGDKVHLGQSLLLRAELELRSDRGAAARTLDEAEALVASAEDRDKLAALRSLVG